MADGGFTLVHGPVLYGPDNRPIPKQIDAAGTGTEYAVPIGGRRRDAAATQVGTDGDWTIPIFDSTGRLHVNAGVAPSGTLFCGTASHSTTASPLNGGSSQPCSGLIVQADPD